MILGYNTTKHISKHSDNEGGNYIFSSEDINLYFVLFLLKYAFFFKDEKKIPLEICIHWTGSKACDSFFILILLLDHFYFLLP